MVVTCMLRGQLCELSHWSPHTPASHPLGSHFAARYQMHSGCGSDDCSTAGCNVEMPLQFTPARQRDKKIYIKHNIQIKGGQREDGGRGANSIRCVNVSVTLRVPSDVNRRKK